MSAGSGPALSDRLRCTHQYCIPQKALTALVYWLTRRRSPVGLKNWAINRFVAAFNVDLSEAEHGAATRYRDFNSFFTRALRPGARHIVEDPDALACPVDGTVSQCGGIDADRLFQAKGRDYSLTTLLGGDPALAQPFTGGLFATLYLSPRDYHRIHMPFEGTLRCMVHIPGRLFSVSPLTTRVVPQLFTRNERLACIFDTAFGAMAVVLVGAVNVASMETVWAGAVTPPYGHGITTRHYSNAAPGESVVLGKGDELGRFNMGSTVILIMPPGLLLWEETIRAGAAVRVGQRLATRQNFTRGQIRRPSPRRG